MTVPRFPTYFCEEDVVLSSQRATGYAEGYVGESPRRALCLATRGAWLVVGGEAGLLCVAVMSYALGILMLAGCRVQGASLKCSHRERPPPPSRR